ncbi:MAG: SAM-dependent methyltransferase, partial [Sphaerospermopsis sp. SIO1G2]|nr:SAM-dependent methyltransferase [Sphaerospermopsis sp. SIO1G2]
MTPRQICFLQTDRAKKTLAQISLTQQTHIQVASSLRRDFSIEEVNALLETVRLRQKGGRKFSKAADMLFEHDALQQASGEEIALYRAGRFKSASIRTIADLCCSLGGDSLAFARVGQVWGVDRDFARLMLAQHNTAVYGLHHTFTPIQADLLELPPLPVQGLFFDPARRTADGKRIFSTADYHPPLSVIDRWREVVPSAAVKISPGVRYEELPPEAEAEFISVDGEVKECVLWYGRLHSGVARRATLLPSQETITTEDLPDGRPDICLPRTYLYEPDGAAIRAHLVLAVADLLGAQQIDADIAYLTSDRLVSTPFATPFAVQDYFPFQLKRLKRYLSDRKIGRLEIKKRGSPIDVDLL